jgi:hypothetical protein
MPPASERLHREAALSPYSHKRHISLYKRIRLLHGLYQHKIENNKGERGQSSLPQREFTISDIAALGVGYLTFLLRKIVANVSMCT